MEANPRWEKLEGLACSNCNAKDLWIMRIFANVLGTFADGTLKLKACERCSRYVKLLVEKFSVLKGDFLVVDFLGIINGERLPPNDQELAESFKNLSFSDQAALVENFLPKEEGDRNRMLKEVLQAVKDLLGEEGLKLATEKFGKAVGELQAVANSWEAAIPRDEYSPKEKCEVAEACVMNVPRVYCPKTRKVVSKLYDCPYCGEPVKPIWCYKVNKDGEVVELAKRARTPYMKIDARDLEEGVPAHCLKCNGREEGTPLRLEFVPGEGFRPSKKVQTAKSKKRGTKRHVEDDGKQPAQHNDGSTTEGEKTTTNNVPTGHQVDESDKSAADDGSAKLGAVHNDASTEHLHDSDDVSDEFDPNVLDSIERWYSGEVAQTSTQSDD